MNIAAQYLAAGPHISGVTGSFLIILIVAAGLMLMRRRGTDNPTLILMALVVIIALALLGGWHLHAVHIPHFAGHP